MSREASTYLGIDYGLSKVGFAIARGGIAGPYGSSDTNLAKNKILEIVESEQLDQIVIGHPAGSLRNAVEEFASNLESESGLPVFLVDETDSTKLAVSELRSHMHPGTDDHALAAKIILENYLDIV